MGSGTTSRAAITRKGYTEELSDHSPCWDIPAGVQTSSNWNNKEGGSNL